MARSKGSQATTGINLGAWCKNPYRTAEQAILSIDLSMQECPDQARHILGVAWTAIVILTKGNGIPAADWLSPMARFHKLSMAARSRVLEAVEMRMRAVERAAL